MLSFGDSFLKGLAQGQASALERRRLKQEDERFRFEQERDLFDRQLRRDQLEAQTSRDQVLEQYYQGQIDVQRRGQEAQQLRHEQTTVSLSDADRMMQGLSPLPSFTGGKAPLETASQLRAGGSSYLQSLPPSTAQQRAVVPAESVLREMAAPRTTMVIGGKRIEGVPAATAATAYAGMEQARLYGNRQAGGSPTQQEKTLNLQAVPTENLVTLLEQAKKQLKEGLPARDYAGNYGKETRPADPADRDRIMAQIGLLERELQRRTAAYEAEMAAKGLGLDQQ